MARRARDLERYNRAFYERCWRAGSVVSMPGVAAAATVRPGAVVEIGSGLRPRLPLDGALFVDLSPTACAKLSRSGARVVRASIAHLPFATASLGAVHAYEVLEHVEDDAAVVEELGRVLRPGGLLVVSTPLHPRRWDEFDRVVGHARRYSPRALVKLMQQHGFVLDGFAPFGMRPRSRLLTRLGLYYLTRRPRLAFRFEERFLRLSGAARAVIIIRRGGSEEFLRDARRMGGVVTAWRSESAAEFQPAS